MQLLLQVNQGIGTNLVDPGSSHMLVSNIKSHGCLRWVATRRKAYPTYSCRRPYGPSTALEQAGDPAKRVAQNPSQLDAPSVFLIF